MCANAPVCIVTLFLNNIQLCSYGLYISQSSYIVFFDF